MVAFMCRLKRTPVSRASATCSARKSVSAERLMNVPSTMSPASNLRPSLSTVTAASAPTNSMRAVVAAAIVTDFSLPKKSPACMEATWALLSGLQVPILCGFAFA